MKTNGCSQKRCPLMNVKDCDLRDCRWYTVSDSINRHGTSAWLENMGHPNLAKMIMDEKRFPSAQPEIIRCKDCKHWIPYDWMFSEVWQSKNIADYPEDDIGCDCCDMAMKANDFCSRAERREETE